MTCAANSTSWPCPPGAPQSAWRSAGERSRLVAVEREIAAVLAGSGPPLARYRRLVELEGHERRLASLSAPSGRLSAVALTDDEEQEDLDALPTGELARRYMAVLARPLPETPRSRLMEQALAGARFDELAQLYLDKIRADER